MDRHALPRRTLILSILGLCLATAPVWAGTNQWTIAGQPSGGTVWGVQVDPVSPNVLYAMSDPGVFESTDYGAHWNLTLSLPGYNFNSNDIAIEPERHSTVYVGNGAYGVWKSTNSGGTWQRVNNGIPIDNTTIPTQQRVYSIAVDPVNDGVVYAATAADGLYKTVDGGAHWNAINNGFIYSCSPTIVSIVIDPVNPQVVYVGDTNFGASAPGCPKVGVFKSTDGGASWNLTTLSSVQVQDMALDPEQHQVLYVAANYTGFYVSSDSGGTWSTINGVSDVSSVRVDPSDSLHILAGTIGDGVYQSMDGGASWAQETTGDAAWVYTLAFDPVSPANVYLGSGHFGAFKSADGGSTWGESDIGIHNVPTGVMVMGTDGVIYLGTSGGGIFKSTDSGASWDAVNGGIDPRFTISVNALVEQPGTPTTLYAGTANGLHKTVDGGGSWTLLNNGLTDPQIQVVTIDPEDTQVVYAGTVDTGVFKSTDGGASWQSSSSGLVGSEVVSLAVDPADSNTIFASMGFSGFFKSIDAGVTWAHVVASTLVPDVQAMVMDPRNHKIIYVTLGPMGSGGIYKSLDGGSTWASVSKGLPQFYVFTSIQIHPKNSSLLYAVVNGGGGVYVSNNGGAKWVSLTQNLSSPTLGGGKLSKTPPDLSHGLTSTLIMESIAVDPSSTRIFGAANDNRIYEFTDSRYVGPTWWW